MHHQIDRLCEYFDAHTHARTLSLSLFYLSTRSFVSVTGTHTKTAFNHNDSARNNAEFEFDLRCVFFLLVRLFSVILFRLGE